MIELLAAAIVLHYRPGPPPPPPTSASVRAFWDRVAQCETGGDWQWGSQFSSPIYEGGVGFATSTWAAWIRDPAAPWHRLRPWRWFEHAFEAPRLWQIAVAQFGLTVRGGYWGCLH